MTFGQFPAFHLGLAHSGSQPFIYTMHNVVDVPSTVWYSEQKSVHQAPGRGAKLIARVTIRVHVRKYYIIIAKAHTTTSIFGMVVLTVAIVQFVTDSRYCTIYNGMKKSVEKNNIIEIVAKSTWDVSSNGK